VIAHTARVKHDGRIHELQIPDLNVGQCTSCGEVVFDDRSDAQITDALRTHLHLLSPQAIRDAVSALGITQKELALRLGVAEATVSRWCTGTLVQSRAMDNLLRSYFAVPQLRAVLVGPAQDPDFGTRVVAGSGE
jgi:putative zinc finger/helix-turn-helix YgiT family protein